MTILKYDNIDSGYMKDYVYETLKKNILEMRLKPGQLLNKEDIAEVLEVSITPIREAFARLSDDELVDIYPQKGTYVSYIKLHKVEEAKFMREHLEKEIVKMACSTFTRDDILKLQINVQMQQLYKEEDDYLKLFELDNDFHKLLFEGCNMGDIWTSIQRFSFHVDRLRLLSLSNYNRDGIVNDHQNILNAITDNNQEKAEKILEGHINRIEFDSAKLKKEYPAYFKNV